MKCDEVLVQGSLLKAGDGKQSGSFLRRFVKLTNSYISYHVLPEAPAIDKISFEDIVGIVCNSAATERDLDAPADGVDLECCFRPLDGLDWERSAAASLRLESRDFVVCTARAGMHRGRQYHFRTPSILEREQWLVSVGRIMQRYRDRPVVPVSDLERIRGRVHWFYVGDRCQILVAALIMLNFALNIVQAAFAGMGPASPLSGVFDEVDLTFTIIFSIELSVNMFATMVRGFVCDVWNWYVARRPLNRPDFMDSDLPPPRPPSSGRRRARASPCPFAFRSGS